MGADIHPYLEAKINGKWIFIGELFDGRNYWLFGALSGVRAPDLYNEGEELFMHNQLPENMSEYMTALTQRDYFIDYHSITVCTYDAMKQWQKGKINGEKLDKKLKELDKRNNAGEISEDEAIKERDKLAKNSTFYASEWIELMDKLMEGIAEDARVILWYDN